MARASFDTGSQRSYVLESTIDEMDITTELGENLTHVVFGGTSSKKKHNCYELIQRGPWVKELPNKGIQFIDIEKSSLPIELLIGADYAGNFFTGNICHLSSGLIAVETYFGWSIMRSPKAASNKYSYIYLFAQSHDISYLWRLETIGIMGPCVTDSSKDLESKAIDYFSSRVKIDEDGRYEVKLPWMRRLDELPTNRYIVGKRLNSTSMKLLKSNKLECYNDVFEEWKNEDFIEDSGEGPGHCLPHRGVFKNQSTTKIRPVFDASCKSRDQYLSTSHDAAVKLQNSFYVDNCVTSVNSEKELRRFIENSTNLMAQAKFDLIVQSS
ncbi:integrase catalytic domain-containing protein [Trichonephila clavata]|uniref:Integrase catalytic domain-containing protein n=1 Tax=Trichonephila clavata TaxID=2740835 RepID=A0A8X6M0N4_TRICU|nr:integrase catalytic domain-containing protein [Trichonephila clavata]